MRNQKPKKLDEYKELKLTSQLSNKLILVKHKVWK